MSEPEDHHIDINLVAARAETRRVSELVDDGKLEQAYLRFVMTRETMRAVSDDVGNQQLEYYAKVGAQLGRALEGAPDAFDGARLAAAQVWEAAAKAYALLGRREPQNAMHKVFGESADRKAASLSPR